MSFASLASAGDDIGLGELEAAFKRMPIEGRQMLQQGLLGKGYYQGAVDGLWGGQMQQAYEALMASDRYVGASSNWEWGHDVQVMETLMFLTSDAYE